MRHHRQERKGQRDRLQVRLHGVVLQGGGRAIQAAYLQPHVRGPWLQAQGCRYRQSCCKRVAWVYAVRSGQTVNSLGGREDRTSESQVRSEERRVGKEC